MLYLIDTDIYDKMRDNRKFKKMNGDTYQQYIIKSTNLTNKIKLDIMCAKTSIECLNILEKNQIEFTHNYLESITKSDDNIKLRIIDKDTLLVE
mgnify:CR=1 FL=1